MFEEGERYRIEGKTVDMFVVGIDKEDDKSVRLAIFWVNQNTGAMLSADEITIQKSDFSKWKKVEVT
jgi:hypothetical protein